MYDKQLNNACNFAFIFYNFLSYIFYFPHQNIPYIAEQIT